jgi:FdhD protein
MKDATQSKHSITRKIDRDSINTLPDAVCVEEPLAISINYQAAGKEYFQVLAISMRTPGDEFELATGLLLSEGIINAAEQIKSMAFDQEQSPANRGNALIIELKKPIDATNKQYERQLTSYSACGICGKTSLQQIELLNPPLIDDLPEALKPNVIEQVRLELGKQQHLFKQTGGSHAAALFDLDGQLLAIKEDVGRHNALDKLIGHCLLNEIAMSEAMIVVSGRASFELVQKTIMAGVPILMAVGAPSSLAISSAERFNLTLIGFLREQRYNVYQGLHRIAH